MSSNSTQGKYWILTIPVHDFMPYLPEGVEWIKGQMEVGETTDFKHWQLIAGFRKKVRKATVRRTFGPYHCELTRSQAAEDYVWKDHTHVEGTKFELGTKTIRRNNAHDWALVRKAAERGQYDIIPDDIFVRYYGNLRNICKDNLRPPQRRVTAKIYWGPSRTGKSFRARSESEVDCYNKCPTTKYWDGYTGQRYIIIDEFRGSINISHLLRWLDPYPCSVEIKGSSVPLCGEHFIFTSNVNPILWYKDEDEETKQAFLKRFELIEYMDETWRLMNEILV